ncbi:heat-and acid-stable phosphoprotein [Paragonimus heterotremus]|uniref:Heat-and acid-stable phosphoprotein n=1 Tax=Paragonimus heterotremus TaxID=100268 RepID=A0A8J4TH63_9TREM|nr:heat-and acid-stable phosphoprotein [Paragonimus heterotremus]
MRGKRSHKGKTRFFTAPEELDRQVGRKVEDDTLQQDDLGPSTSNKAAAESPQTSDTSGDDDEGTDEVHHKGMSHLIEVCNPNQGAAVTDDGPSRKEMEAAARAVTDPLKLKSEVELASDLARLALVRKEREQAALKREQEKQARDAAREAAAQRAQAKLQALRQKGKPGQHKRATAKEPTKKTTDAVIAADAH